MNLADCYYVLGLRPGASHREIKAAYRRLAREYHPDTNPDHAEAQAKFIQLTEAYKSLMAQVPPDNAAAAASSIYDQEPMAPRPAWNSAPSTGVKVTVSPPTTTYAPRERPEPTVVQFSPELSDMDRQLKHQSYHQLRGLLQTRRIPRAIALIEGLAQRLPQDREVRQWQAITYQRWARQLIQEKQYDKGRVYLKKALKTDPHNKSLWLEVDQEFQRLDKLYGTR
ncbi:J domain-containing protein [Prochlorothrix hollandica]|uniref:Molecular chaperone DnaJ n=1 Tax=Prochlorothrix hollandica PCC 9006 = CALU 1027 TaxID=317619 RepID=A0A0M2PVQ6_PROHO|nr:J domain-containing protein [Prochlorothrix hollandica]KKI98446.1 molecular chaperone DnaJ [Prochlorothrix hollandica PCC 9006 = CALU 1027]